MATITKRGSNYHVRIRHKGYPTQSKTFTTRPDARAWASSVEGEMLRGVFVSRVESERTTLQQALDRYALEVTPNKKGAARELQRIRLWKDHPLSYRALASIRGADMAKYRNERAAQGVSGNTIRLDLALVSHVYEVARKEWGMECLVNPVKAIRRPKLAKGRERRLHVGEEEALLGYCDRKGNYALRAAIKLALETAMRRGELLRLRWKDIDLNRRIATLDDSKNGESRQVPLSGLALEALRTLPRRIDGKVLGLHCDALSHAFCDACKALGLHDLRFHDLRHEATTRLFERGLNTMQVAAITGHKTLQMLKRYTHLRVEDMVSMLG